MNDVNFVSNGCVLHYAEIEMDDWWEKLNSRIVHVLSGSGY